MTAPAPVTKSPSAKRGKKVVESEGVAHIAATFNNLLITITDLKGNTLAWGSAGKAGFKGSKKPTPFAATVPAENCGRAAMNLGFRRAPWPGGAPCAATRASPPPPQPAR